MNLQAESAQSDSQIMAVDPSSSQERREFVCIDQYLHDHLV